MFTIIRLRQTALGTWKNIRNLQVSQIRGYLPIRRSDSFFKIPQPKLKEVQVSNITPEGFKVIYISPLHTILNVGHVVLLLMWPMSFGLLYYCITNPNWFKEHFGPLNTSKIWIVVSTVGALAGIHWTLFRHVRYIFKKGDQYISLFHGVLGPLRVIPVHHGKYSYEKHYSAYFFHSLKNKKVIIFSEAFEREHDYYELLAVVNQDRSYL